jgi:hypothetical protein
VDAAVFEDDVVEIEDDRWAAVDIDVEVLDHLADVVRHDGAVVAGKVYPLAGGWRSRATRIDRGSSAATTAGIGRGSNGATTSTPAGTDRRSDNSPTVAAGTDRRRDDTTSIHRGSDGSAAITTRIDRGRNDAAATVIIGVDRRGTMIVMTVAMVEPAVPVHRRVVFALGARLVTLTEVRKAAMVKQPCV